MTAQEWVSGGHQEGECTSEAGKGKPEVGEGRQSFTPRKLSSITRITFTRRGFSHINHIPDHSSFELEGIFTRFLFSDEEMEAQQDQ